MKWYPKRIRRLVKKMTEYGMGFKYGLQWSLPYNKPGHEEHLSLYSPPDYILEYATDEYKRGFYAAFQEHYEASLERFHEHLSHEKRVESARTELRRKKWIYLSIMTRRTTPREKRRASSIVMNSLDCAYIVGCHLRGHRLMR